MLKDSNNGLFCVYPVKGSERLISDVLLRAYQLENSEILPFGIPFPLASTNTRIPTLGVLYHPDSSIFLTLSTESLQWHLIGYGVAVAHYMGLFTTLNGIYYDAYKQLADASPLTSATSQTPAVSPPPTYQRELPLFLDWLSMNHPMLALQWEPLLTYDDGPNPFATSLAQYNPSQDKIVLRPAALEMMLQGEYELLFYFLLHEATHRELVMANVLSPIAIIGPKVVASYATRLYDARPGKTINEWKQALGSLQPLYYPDEEILAYLKQFDAMRSDPDIPESELENVTLSLWNHIQQTLDYGKHESTLVLGYLLYGVDFLLPQSPHAKQYKNLFVGCFDYQNDPSCQDPVSLYTQLMAPEAP